MNTPFHPSLPTETPPRRPAPGDRRPLMALALPATWLTVALTTGGCSKTPVEDPRLQPQSVAVFKVEAAEPGSRSFTGTVAARVQSDLGFRVGGKVQERSVNLGQRVRKGQILMRLDAVDLDLSLAAQQANVEAARAGLVKATADEARLVRLVKTGAVSLQEHEHAKTALDSAIAQLDAAEAQAKVTRNSSGYSTLSAESDGVIVATLAEPGQVVAAGQTVLQLAHDGAREALIHLPEGVRPELGTAASARLYGQEKNHRAVLRQLSDAADPVSRTFEARYVLDGEAATAPLGSTVTVALAGNRNSDSQPVVVPVGAVHDRGGGTGVWVVNEKSAVTFRIVTVASIGREEIVVSRGIDAGESVVALGPHLLHERQTVNLKNEKNTPDASF
jgi:RND family efflux transporter MFP subunit